VIVGAGVEGVTAVELTPSYGNVNAVLAESFTGWKEKDIVSTRSNDAKVCQE